MVSGSPALGQVPTMAPSYLIVRSCGWYLAGITLPSMLILIDSLSAKITVAPALSLIDKSSV